MKQITAKKEQETQCLIDLKDKQKSEMNKIIEEYNFNDVHEVINYYLTKDEIKMLKNKIKEYNDLSKTVSDNISRIKGQLKDNKLDKAYWITFKQHKAEIQEQYNNMLKSNASLTTEIVQMKKDIEQMKILNEKKKEIEHKLSMFDDIDYIRPHTRDFSHELGRQI